MHRYSSVCRSTANTLALSSCCAVLGCRLQHENTISAASEPPKRAALHCSAAQILVLGGPLESPLLDLCRVLASELTITSIRVPSTYLRAVFDRPSQLSPAQPSPRNLCMHATRRSIWILSSLCPCSTAAQRHGATFWWPERGNMTQLLRLASHNIPRPTTTPATRSVSRSSHYESPLLEWPSVHRFYVRLSCPQFSGTDRKARSQ